MASEEREPTLEELMAELDAGPDILAPPPPAISKPVALPASDTVGDDRCAKPVATTASAPAKAKRPDAIARPVGDEGNDPTGSSSSAAGAPKDEFAQLEESFYQAQSLVKSFWKSTRETLKETAASAQQSAQHAMHSQHIGEMADVLNNASRELRATAHDVVASAKTLNTRLLVKPLATFGVPLTVVMQRECDEEDAEAAPSIECCD